MLRTTIVAPLGAAVVLCATLAGPPALAEPELIRAFAFGSRQLVCPTQSQPGVNYTIVWQGSAADLEYSAARGWGYEVTHPAESGYFRFGPFDDSANSRTQFPDTCPEELYDSFIGAKNWDSFCAAAEPCGIVFRADVPDGRYRFVAAVGSADNEHSHRIAVEDGGAGPPNAMGPDHVVIVDGFDQAVEGVGVFARVGFDGRIPPPAAVNGFVDMGEDGLPAAIASSPTLEVTSGYIRLHQLRAPTAGTDGNGGDMVILELWRLDSQFRAVERGATWRYHRGLTEASTPVDAWRGLGFDDSSWDVGSAPFGYGDPPFGVDLSTLAPPMENNYSTLFLRREFQVSNAAAIDMLLARVDYDDGFVMWINGVEVLRINVNGLEGDPVAFDDFSSAGHESGVYEEFFLPDPAGYLLDGRNVVAVQVFNTTITSSDLKLDLDLVDPDAPDVTPPEVSAIGPAAGATVRSLSRIEVTFTEDVNGVDTGDLLVDGGPATTVGGGGRGPYVFTFPPVAEGLVSVAWAAGHGITDLSEFVNPFAGGSWGYTVDPSAPPGDIVINEILASNITGLVDEDGDTSDWFEVVNRGTDPVDLSGWAVTTDRDGDGAWTFPAVTIGPSEYLVVFASGKDRRPAGGAALHTDFELSATGEYIGLLNGQSPREVVSEIAPRYPRQKGDVSYGLDGFGSYVYLATPTPGAANSVATAFEGYTIEPECRPARGLLDGPADVVITTITPGALIRYTVDGSEPTPTRGTPYTGPVRVAPSGGRGMATLRAIAYRDDFLPSEVATHSYVFVEDVMRQSATPSGFPTSWNGQPADYGMDSRVVNDPGHNNLVRQGLRSVPTLSIVTHVDNLFHPTTGIYANPSREGIAWERPVSAELIDPDGGEGFQVDCGLRIQGGSSTSGWKAIKVSMRLLFKGAYGPSRLRFPLFPDTPVDEFNTIVLDAHLNQTWNHPSLGQRSRAQYCRDQFVSDLQNAAGGRAPHDIFVNLYLDGIYWGVYDVHERPDAEFAASYFGGDAAEYDCLRHSGSTVVDGNTQAWNTMRTLAGRDLSLNSNYQALAGYLDVPDLVDYMLVNIWAGNDDWAHHNWYATRLRQTGALYRFHSWDAEHVLKSLSIDRTGVSNSNSPAEFYDRLRANAEFRLLFADHAHRHFFNGGILYVDASAPAWDAENPDRNRPASFWMRRIDEIDPAIACESARWGDAKQSTPHTRNNEWLTELAWILDYLEDRSARVLDQLRGAGLYPTVGAPIFSRHGGRVQPGFVLTMARPAGTGGTIYYTTDGTDPRVWGSGAVSSRASSYAGAITIDDHTVVMARILSGGTWSALNQAVFSLADPAGALRITEIMYNPAGGSGEEFIELRNDGALTIDLTGVAFTNGIAFRFADGDSLAPGDYLVLVSSPIGFESRYPGVEIAGVYNGQLANGGERVTIATDGGGTVFSVEYDDEGFWELGADGFGYSLVLLEPDGDPDDPLSWRASAAAGGSPGAADPNPPPGGVVIHEVLARASAPFERAIELFNPMPAPVDIGGWFLSNSRDSAGELARFRIPAGVVVPPGELVVLYEQDFRPGNGGGSPGFTLDPAGGEVFLAGAGGAGNLTGYIVGAAYGAALDGVSWGRAPTSVGPVFTALDGPTFGVDFPATVEEFRTGTGAANETALFGPIVLNEVMYHPEGNGEEFIELLNPTGAPISLFDAALGRGWRVTGVQNAFETDSFEFGPGDEIPAGGFLVLAGIDPGLFRSLNAVPGAVPVAGPFGGGIDNGGERLRLMAPELIDGAIAYVTIDEVRYDDGPPWPQAADGGGASLERLGAGLFGDDPASWAASTRAGGTPGSANTASTGGNLPPRASFTASPASGMAPLTVRLDASGSFDADGALVLHEWDLGDGGTAAGRVVTHTFVTPGDYLVVLTVEDDEGATDSAPRLVSVAELRGGQRIGDGNQDGVLDISDAVSLLRRLFLPGQPPLPCEGVDLEDGGNRVVFDVNGDAAVNLSDAVSVLDFLFKKGPPPALGAACVRVPGCPEVCAP